MKGVRGFLICAQIKEQDRPQQGGFPMPVHADDLSVATNRKLQIMKSNRASVTTSLKVQLLILASVAVMACGCSSVDPKRMVPKLDHHSQLNAGSIRIREVSGGKKGDFGGMETVTNEQFQKALIMALEKSGLFSGVSTGSGDLELYATIRAQDTKVSRGLQYTATMVASYKIQDKAGKVLWSESFDSQSSSVAFSGATRMVQAREGSVRENLAALIKGLQERWPKQR